jgi:hypothetical protein
LSFILELPILIENPTFFAYSAFGILSCVIHHGAKCKRIRWRTDYVLRLGLNLISTIWLLTI